MYIAKLFPRWNTFCHDRPFVHTLCTLISPQNRILLSNSSFLNVKFFEWLQLFVDDIHYLSSMETLWRTRQRPDSIDWLPLLTPLLHTMADLSSPLGLCASYLLLLILFPLPPGTRKKTKENLRKQEPFSPVWAFSISKIFSFAYILEHLVYRLAIANILATLGWVSV